MIWKVHRNFHYFSVNHAPVNMHSFSKLTFTTSTCDIMINKINTKYPLLMKINNNKNNSAAKSKAGGGNGDGKADQDSSGETTNHEGRNEGDTTAARCSGKAAAAVLLNILLLCI